MLDGPAHPQTTTSSCRMSDGSCHLITISYNKMSIYLLFNLFEATSTTSCRMSDGFGGQISRLDHLELPDVEGVVAKGKMKGCPTELKELPPGQVHPCPGENQKELEESRSNRNQENEF